MLEMSKKATESVVESPSDDSLWLEWSDALLNKENWAVPKSKEKCNKNIRFLFHVASHATTILDGPDGLFLDTQVVQLPSSLEAHEWIRAKDLPNLTEPVTLFVPTLNHVDLVASNKHLLHSEFARWFISTLINLQYCGRDGLEISGENGNFIWNGRNQSWQGWLNVYSMNKAGRGVQHRPVVNPNGKYIVRLYFLGSWRRIIVDDMVPVNAEMLPLLPRTSYDFELWPMLLSKALLKLASLTWSGCHEIVDFHPVTCLTGWVCLQLHVGYMSPQDKWDFLRKYAEHFEWQAEVARVESQDVPRSRKSKEAKASKETVRTRKSKETDRSELTGRTKDDNSKVKTLAKPQPVTLFLGLEDTKVIPPDDLPELASCWSHFIYVAQSRDVPLDPKDVKPPLARWKLHRWLKWAIDEGIIDPIEYFMPIRSLKVVSPLKRCKESIINKYDSSNTGNNTKTGYADSGSKVIESDATSKPRETSKDPHEPIVMETIQEDPCFWADFNKMEPSIKEVVFFYKLDYFRYTANLSDRFGTRHETDQKSDARRGSKKDSGRSSPSRAMFKDPEFVDTHGWPRPMSKTRNEPLYILTDSLHEKFFLISFSTFQVSSEIIGEQKMESEPKISMTVLKGTKDCLSVEAHNWFRRPEKSNHLLSILTAGTKSNVLEIDRGRHLLRLYCHSESDCFVSISSDTIFHVGDRRRMYRLMCTESERIDHAAKCISNAIGVACQAFGTERFPAALRNYYKSYLPAEIDLAKHGKQFYKQLHDYFVDEEVQLIRRHVPKSEVAGVLRSLRIFFLNPTIGSECFNVASIYLKDSRELSSKSRLVRGYRSRSLSSSTSRLLIKDHAATILQAFFKTVVVRKYRKIHDPSHPEHQRVSDSLLKVAELFNYNKRESLANQLLRNILKHHDKLCDIYPFSKDFERTLQVQELRGTLSNVKQNQWLPIVRLVVNAQPGETVLASVDLFIDLPRYSVRVFKNDSCREMLRVVNNVVPTRYPQRRSGYTIFCYGWSEDKAFKELPYSFNIVGIKGQPMFHFIQNEIPLPLITVPPVLKIEELSNTYIPNAGNFVCKWIVRVARSCIASFRLRVSYENCRMRFRVTDQQKHVLAQVIGTCVVILPMVYLEFIGKAEQGIDHRTRNSADGDNANGRNGEEKNSGEEKVDGDGDRGNEDLSGRTIYYADASILDDSWPLTRTEWSRVSEFKVKPTGSLVKTKLPLSWSGTKLSRAESMKSRTESIRSRKGSRQTIDSTSLLESPFWVLQVVTDSDSGLEICQDRTKEKEIARLKATWAEENPESLERGRELREAFIKKYEIQPKSSTCSMESKSSNLSSRSSSKKISQKPSIVGVDIAAETSVTSLEERTLKAPPSLRRLPPLDLSVYEATDDTHDQPFAKTESHEGIPRDAPATQIVQAEEGYANFLSELEGLMEKQKEQYRMLYGDYLNAFEDRRADLEKVYEARTAYINSTKPVAASSTKSIANKKSKVSSKKT